MLTALGHKARAFAGALDPWTNVYGAARSVLALGTALTLAANATSTVFRPGAGGAGLACSGARSAGAFCIAGEHHLELARWLCVVALLVIASGWRPRWTGVLHWWIAFSFQANATTIDGGDNVAAVLALWLVPVTLTDDRVWHWSARSPSSSERETMLRLIARAALIALRIQVAGIYFHAAIAKFAVREWTEGTALYYWFLDPALGAPPWLAPTAHAVLANGAVVAAATWGVLVFEYTLSAALFMGPRGRRALLVLGIAFHLGILVMHGLVSFACSMTAALIVYLRPHDAPFRIALDGARAHVRRLVARRPHADDAHRAIAEVAR